MEQELKLKKKGVSGVLVFFLIILFTAAGLVGGWYVGKENLIKIGTDKEEKEEAKEEEVEEKEESKVGQCLNCKNDNKYSFSDKSSIGLGVELNSDMKSVIINARIEELNSAYALSLTSLGDNEYYTNMTVDGFEKKIVQVKIGGFGQAVGDESIFYVMEDGTIEYTPVLNELKNNWSKDNLSKLFKTRKKIENVDNVSFITGASVVSGTTGHYTTVAIKKDGSYYDLHDMIER